MKHLLHKDLASSTHLLSVAVVGVGGTGSHVLTNLAMINQGLKALGRPEINVKAVDPEKVTEANVGRQIYSPSDIGEYKAEVIVSRLNRYYGTDWDYSPVEFNIDHISNIVITCVDTIKARKEIYNVIKNQRYSTDKTIYWMDIGNERSLGQIILGTIQDKTLPTFFDRFKTFNIDRTLPSCSVAESLMKQDLFINKMMATYAGHMLWSLLKEYFIEYSGIFINLNTMQIQKIPIEEN